MKELDIWDLVKKAEEDPAPVAESYEGHPTCEHCNCYVDGESTCCDCGAHLTDGVE